MSGQARAMRATKPVTHWPIVKTEASGVKFGAGRFAQKSKQPSYYRRLAKCGAPLVGPIYRLRIPTSGGHDKIVGPGKWRDPSTFANHQCLRQEEGLSSYYP